ncbi:MAG: hypothetical protein ACR2QE_17675 [Acidimicrobiales bacterium]
MRRLIIGVVPLLVAIGCASGEGPTTVTGTVTSTAATSTAAPSTSGAALAVDAGHTSTARLVIEGNTWDFDVSCAQPSEADVLVWGSGVDPETDLPAELLLEASVSDPYIGVTASGRLIEASLDTPLVLEVDAGTITGDDISFVADADINTGLGTDLGPGSVTVECTSYIESPLTPG